jgi:hypothetical protein
MQGHCTEHSHGLLAGKTHTRYCTSAVEMITTLAVLEVILFRSSVFSRNSRGRSGAQPKPSLSSRDPSSLLNIVLHD